MTMRIGTRRTGLTLLEVIVSMAIFLISVTALYQLVLMGGERAMDIRLQTRTSMRCQAKLAELMIGAEPLNSSGTYATFPEEYDKGLQWKVEASESGDAKGLWHVKVWVKAELPTGRSIESQLCQLMLDPSIRGTTFDEPDTTPPGTPTKDAPAAPSTTTPDAKTPDPSTPKNSPPNTNAPKTNPPPKTTAPKTTTPAAKTPPPSKTTKGG